MNIFSLQFIERFLGQFRYATKFIIIGLLSLTACLVLFVTLYSHLNVSVAFAEKEIVGVEKINSLLKILDYAQQRRGVANQVLTGNAEAESNLARLDNELDKQFDLVEKNLSVEDPLAIKSDWNGLNALWKSLKTEARGLTPDKSFIEHTDLIDMLQALIVKAADNSNLTLDPELSSYFFMDVVTAKMPLFIELSAKLRGKGVKILNEKQLVDKERENFQIIVYEQASALVAAQSSLSKAIDAAKHPEFDVLKEKMDSLKKDNKVFIGLTQREIIDRQFTISSSQYFSAGTTVTKDSYALVAQVSDILKKILQERVAEDRSSLLMVSVITISGIVVIALLFFVLARSTSQSIAQANEVIGRMADGDFSASLKVATRDEMGQLSEKVNQTNTAIGKAIVDANRVLLAAAEGNFAERIDAVYRGDLDKLSKGINTTVAQIAEAQQQQAVEKQRAEQAASEARSLADEIGRKAEADRKVAEENYRIRMALDSVSTNAMIADADGIIIYGNNAIKNLLRNAEPDIRTHLPGFSSSSVIGSNFDMFHRNPAHQRNMLGSLRSTHSTQMSIGGRTFRLTANPIVNAEGARLGTVVEWLDRTQEVAVEKEIDQVVSAAASGNFTVTLNTEDKEGFFLSLSKNLNQLIDVTRHALDDISIVIAGLSEGDLKVKMQRNYQGAFGDLQNNISSTIAQLTETISGIRSAASSIAQSAREVDSGAQDLSGRTEEQAASLEETAASMEEMTQSVQQSADNARNASALVMDVQKRAQTGTEIVSGAVESMEGIRKASKKVVDIVSIIDDIAFQTNLLALNAAVEASRAGEHGRGFAVVAGEVRNLAQNSSSAAKEIRQLINDSVSRIEHGVKLVSETGSNLHEIKDAVEHASEMVQSIAHAVREQAVGISEVNKAITRMEENTQQNAAMVEQSSAAVANMSSQCDEMNDLVGFFRV